VHLGGCPAKPHGRPAMSCGLPALDKFPSGSYASRKYVVMLGHAVMVGKLWYLKYFLVTHDFTFIHDHHELQYKTLFNVTYLDENHASLHCS
jgi:hypothetical protein